MMGTRAQAARAAGPPFTNGIHFTSLPRLPSNVHPSSLSDRLRDGSAASVPPGALVAQRVAIAEDDDDASDDDLPDSLIGRHKLDFRAQANASFIQPAPLNLSSNRPLLNSQGRPFPLSAASQPHSSNDVPISERYRLDGSFFLDGGCANKEGSSSFICYYQRVCHAKVLKLPRNQGTNNVAEFHALLEALSYAALKRLKRILIVTDSQLVANFIKGLNRITQEHLIAITLKIRALLASFDAIFVSHIHAHRDLLIENDVADALCTWAIKSGQTLDCSSTPSRSGICMTALSIKVQTQTPAQAVAALSSRDCSICHQNAKHKSAKCPIFRFSRLTFAHERCFICLSPHHSSAECPLMVLPARRPVLSSLTPGEPPAAGERDRERAARLYSTNIDDFHFPNNCSRSQFLDYYYTALLGLYCAETEVHVTAARKAVRAFHHNFHFENLTIKRSKPPKADARDPGNNRNPPVVDAEDDLARRALRAAKLVPRARPSDVAKALRTGDKVPLSADIISKLSECYPAADGERVVFEPKPLPSFAVSRDAVARVIMARKPSSHPGAMGMSFDALQHFCRWTYKAEEPDKPDHRWDLLCLLIAKIMSGNAAVLSDLLLDVVGAFFDKNAEKPDAPFALRNLGIEESLLRIAATLVFEHALPLAIQHEHLSLFDLGAGKKSGAEIFGRIAAMFSSSGAPIAVFDVVKAFNNLRRQDIKDAVANFNDPLLSAFVHFLFSKDSKVTFTCPVSQDAFVVTLQKGIHQGNPLSVFIFCLTIAYILKDFRAEHPNVLVTSFVDDLQFIMHKDSIEVFPETLARFLSIFDAHGLRFDLSDSAKSSVYSVHALPLHIRNRITNLGMRCQNNGIAPCKIACGSKAFVDAHAEKLKAKLHNRFTAFQALWKALVQYDRKLKKPTNLYFEHFLNLVRLSFLSMPMYVLRTLKPSACVAYRRCSSDWGLVLIRNVFPPFIPLPPSAIPNAIEYPDLEGISRDLLQIPLSLGGLSCRLPDSIGDIAYAASCMDSLPLMRAASLKLGVQCAVFLIPDLSLTIRRIQLILPALDNNFWKQAEDPLDDLRREPLQHTLTTFLNAADISAVAERLTPWPIYHHAFMARTHKMQAHASWPINPAARAHHSLGPLCNSEFSRTIALATLYPVVAPRVCECGKPIDPAAFHLLHCRFNHFGFMHDCVKKAVAHRLQSFSAPDIAPLVVQSEQPVRLHYPLRDASASVGPELVADLVVSLHGDVQQEPIICDFTSCLARLVCREHGFNGALRDAARLKVAKYHKYAVPAGSFFPLPFGRTNVLSTEIFSFCSEVGARFPKHFRVERKLLATFSRSIYVGVAHTFNLAMRRLQLAVSTLAPLQSIRPLPLLLPFAPQVRSRPLPRNPSMSALTEPLIYARIAAVFAGSSSDSQELREFLEDVRHGHDSGS